MNTKRKRLTKQFLFRDIALIVICGVILSLPFLNYYFGWLSFLVLVPFFWYLNSLQKRSLSSKQFILRIWAIGFVFFFVTISWLFNIRATDLIADPWLRWLFLSLTLIIIVTVYSVGFLIFAVVIKRFKISLDDSKSFLLLPALWIVCEFLRSFAFSAISYGKGASIGDLWNFGNLGFSASVTPMAYGGRIVGFYGISFLVVLLNLVIYQLLLGKLKKQAIICLTLVVLVPGLGFIIWRGDKPNSTAKAGLTFLESDFTIRGDYRDDLIYEIKKQNIDKTGILILPEYSDIFVEEYSAKKDNELVGVFTKRNNNLNIITSVSLESDAGRTNSVALYNEKGELLKYQDKQFLIPGGEYVPYLYQAILIASGNSSFVVSHQQDKTLLKGSKPAEPIEISGVKYGVLACSGAIAPQYYQRLTKDGAEVLVNSASIASMGLDGFYYEQSKQMARFIAVANNKQFVQSSRGGHSYVISRDGEFEPQSKGAKTQYFNIDIQPNSSKTLYSAFGEWFLAFSTVSLGGYLIYSAIKKT